MMARLGAQAKAIVAIELERLYARRDTHKLRTA